MKRPRSLQNFGSERSLGIGAKLAVPPSTPPRWSHGPSLFVIPLFSTFRMDLEFEGFVQIEAGAGRVRSLSS
jgi:hypothetical protein